jgi:hypothetical protein
MSRQGSTTVSYGLRKKRRNELDQQLENNVGIRRKQNIQVLLNTANRRLPGYINRKALTDTVPLEVRLECLLVR